MQMASHETQPGGINAGTEGQNQVTSGKSEGFYTSGMEHYSNRRWEEAAAAFEQALELNPQHMGALKYIGLSSYHLGRYTRAQVSLHQFLERESDDEQALWYCGKVHLELVHYPEAERLLRRLILVNPRSAQGYGSLGSIYYRRGLYAEAVAMFRKALELEQNDPDIYFLLGEAYNKLDQVGPAVECFEELLKIQPENPRVYYYLGILYDKKGNPDKASLMYRQARDLSIPGAERRSKVSPVSDAGGKGLFFSRSLTVVAESPDFSAQSGVDTERYEKLRRLQKNRKKRKFVPEVNGTGEKAGTMDLTKASLKIEEAIRTIKEKHN